jgi:hypothetical protein
MLPRVPEPISRVAAVTISSPTATVPKARGGSMAASANSDPNQNDWPATWPAPTHDIAPRTAATVGVRGGRISCSGDP